MNLLHDIQKWRPRTRVITLVGCLLAGAVLLVFLFVAPRFLPALGPKTGRIIDHDTGEGIAGATVVARGSFEANGGWRSIHSCAYASMTTTDKAGYYSLPSEYSHWTFASPSIDSENVWLIFASKDGYVQADVKWPFDFDSSGRPRVNTWSSTGHATPLKGIYIQIPPIELMQVSMSLKERIAYFGNTGLSRYCSSDNASFKEMRSAVRKFYASVTEEICGSPPQRPIESSTVSLLMLYADDVQEFLAAWRALDPHLNQLHSPSDFHFYTMSETCKVAKAGAASDKSNQAPKSMVIPPTN